MTKLTFKSRAFLSLWCPKVKARMDFFINLDGAANLTARTSGFVCLPDHKIIRGFNFVCAIKAPL